jgi:hypothetical protein
MAAEKLISGGRPPGMDDAALNALIQAWQQLGVHLSPDDFGRPKPAKYQLAKITMVLQLDCCCKNIPSMSASISEQSLGKTESS